MTRHDRPARPGRTARVVALPLVILLGACSSDDGGAEPPAAAEPSSTTAPEATTTSLVPFGPLDSLPVVEIEPTDLPTAPPGFVAADVEALADQVVVIAQRGLDERVWTASPHTVIDHVLGDLPPGAASGYQAATTETHGRVISWPIADSFDAELLPIGPPRVLARRLSAEAVSAADGTPALQVELRLSLAYAFEPDPGLQVALVQRSLRLGSIRPQDPATEPGLGTTTHADAIERCALVVDGLIRPADDPADYIEHFLSTIDPADPGWGKDRDGSSEETDTTDC